MAVLRPDQAQLTFAAEAGPGGDVEIGTPTFPSSSAGSTSVTIDTPVGSRTITVGSSTNFNVGDQISIGYTTDDSLVTSCREIRRIERISGTTAPITFTLDRPTGFFHAGLSSSHVKEAITWTPDVNNAPADKLITWIPGVYETVDTPDPVMAIEPRYFLGTEAKRDFFRAYKGQQTFTGALNGIVLLNGWPLRFPFGSVVTRPATNPTTSEGSTIASSTGSKKGDIYLQVATAGNFAVGDYIIVGYVLAVDTDSLRNSGSATGNNIPEVRQVVGITGSILRLSSPLLYDHLLGAAVGMLGSAAETAGEIYYHHIVETIDLSSLTWQVRVADSEETAANAFIRRYVGGKVGSASISAEEGGLVTMNWDNVVFMDMVHNQGYHLTTTNSHGGTIGIYPTAHSIPGHALIHDIQSDDVGPPGSFRNGFPSDEPYYFSQGTVKLWGQEFARIRSFNLTVNNNEDPRYYISGQYGRHRGPSEIREQRREYGMSCIVALPDSTSANSGDLAGATSIFKELLLEGQYDTSTMKGFKVELFFEKENGDAIKIYLPGLDPTQNTTIAATINEPARTLSGSGNEQGCFIRSAAHNITGEAPLQTDVEILFRNMHIIIKDKTPIYP